jgi:hypothetical protein
MTNHHLAACIPLAEGIRRWRFFLLFFLAFILCWPLFPQPVHAQENDSGDNQPFIVSVWIGVIDIPDVDEPLETFDLDMYITLQWNDPRAYEYIQQGKELSPDGKYRSDSTVAALNGLDEIGWANLFQFTNQVGQRDILNASLWIDTKGNITYDERFQASFRSNYELKAFPFDSQKFHLEIETFNLDKTMVIFEASKDTVIFYQSPTEQNDNRKTIYLEEWIVKDDIDCFVGEYTSKMSGRSYSYISIDMIAERKSGFHVWKIFLPLILIIGISWSSFWIGKEAVASRLSMSSIGFLTIVSFGFYLTSSLPKISYLTFMDTFIIGAYSLMGLTVLEVLATYFLMRQGKEMVADRMNYHSRWAFPLCLCLYLVIMALVLR